MEKSKKRFVRSEKALSANIDGEEILLNQSTGVYLALNSVASEVWRLIETPRSIEEVIDEVGRIYDVDHARCKKDIGLFFGELKDKDLVVELSLDD